VDGAGSRALIPAVWEHASQILDGAVAVPLEEAAGAIRVLADRARVIAEGAGALPVAAALAGRVPGRRIVCIVSGGNVDLAVLAQILAGATPR
jgi:threonine dehydratase